MNDSKVSHKTLDDAIMIISMSYAFMFTEIGDTDAHDSDEESQEKFSQTKEGPEEEENCCLACLTTTSKCALCNKNTCDICANDSGKVSASERNCPECAKTSVGQEIKDSHEEIPSTGDGPTIGGQGCLTCQTTESICALCGKKVCDICAVDGDMMPASKRNCAICAQESSKQQSKDSHEKIPSTGNGPTIGGQGCLPCQTTESKCALCGKKVCDICAVDGEMMQASKRKCAICAQESSKQQSKDSQEKIPSTGDGPTIGSQGYLPCQTTESKCALCGKKVCDTCAVNGDMMEATHRKCTECTQESSEEHINDSQEKTTSTEHLKSPKTIQWG